MPEIFEDLLGIAAPEPLSGIQKNGFPSSRSFINIQTLITFCGVEMVGFAVADLLIGFVMKLVSLTQISRHPNPPYVLPPLSESGREKLGMRRVCLLLKKL
ncbi:MAG: hypothetical protein MUO76_01365 [Anaerolineaceae bacterium]|nr:hypothetical protein [Anaerolineaceae bacterium]